MSPRCYDQEDVIAKTHRFGWASARLCFPSGQIGTPPSAGGMHCIPASTRTAVSRLATRMLDQSLGSHCGGQPCAYGLACRSIAVQIISTHRNNAVKPSRATQASRS